MSILYPLSGWLLSGFGGWLLCRWLTAVPEVPEREGDAGDTDDDAGE